MYSKLSRFKSALKQMINHQVINCTWNMIFFNGQTVHLFEIKNFLNLKKKKTERNIEHCLATILTVDDGHGNGSSNQLDI